MYRGKVYLVQVNIMIVEKFSEELRNTNTGFRQGLTNISPEFWPFFKAFFPEGCLDLGTFFPKLLEMP